MPRNGREPVVRLLPPNTSDGSKRKVRFCTLGIECSIFGRAVLSTTEGAPSDIYGYGRLGGYSKRIKAGSTTKAEAFTVLFIFYLDPLYFAHRSHF